MKEKLGLSAEPIEMSAVDVVVIGAGFAGIAAAYMKTAIKGRKTKKLRIK